MDSSDSGTPGSKEPIGANPKRARPGSPGRSPSGSAARTANAAASPATRGKVRKRDPDPGERKTAAPPAGCRSCKASLDGAAPAAAEPRWAQVIDARILRTVTEFLLPGLVCPCCGEVTFAAAPPGLHAGGGLLRAGPDAAAVLLTRVRERSRRAVGAAHRDDPRHGRVGGLGGQGGRAGEARSCGTPGSTRR